MYDNETGKHILIGWEKRQDCLWLIQAQEEDTPRLYLIPPEDVVAEIEGGPDDEVLSHLNEICRTSQAPTSKELASLGLIIVPWHLRGFTEKEGYSVSPRVWEEKGEDA